MANRAAVASLENTGSVYSINNNSGEIPLAVTGGTVGVELGAGVGVVGIGSNGNANANTATATATTLTLQQDADPPAPNNTNSTNETLNLEVKERMAKLVEALDEISNCSLIEVMEALETLLVYTRNLIQYPEEKKYRKVKVSNIHYQERLGHLPGAQHAMGAIGYGLSGEYLRLDESKVKSDGNTEALVELEKLLTQRLDDVKRQFSILPPRLTDNHVFSSVVAAAAHSEIGKRNNMEDDEIIIDAFCGDPNQGFFGLYDGHGGRATVDFVVKVLHTNLEKQLRLQPNFADAFKQAYLATDGQLRRQNILRSGSTSVTCVVRVDERTRTRRLYCANVGDSRAVLARNGQAVRLTIDHKPSLQEEEKRILNAGGFIGKNKRVNGVLAISRALGDHMLKENDVVTAVPYCQETTITTADSLVILACDGVWDVMSDQEAVDLVLSKIKTAPLSPSALENGRPKPGHTANQVLKTAAKALVKESLDRRTLDNVTVIIIQLQ